MRLDTADALLSASLCAPIFSSGAVAPDRGKPVPGKPNNRASWSPTWLGSFFTSTPQSLTTSLTAGERRMRTLSNVLALVAFVASAVMLAHPAQGPTDGWLTTSDGAKIHYLAMGKGVPVVLIHGGGGSAENWFATGIAQVLAKNHHVVALDCRGHGKSDYYPRRAQGQASQTSDGVASIRNWPVLDVVELMDHLKIEKAHIHGYSWGGTITEQLLATYPQRFISAAFGGWGIPEIDPEMKAKVPPDKTGSDPLDAEAIARFRERVAANTKARSAPDAAPGFATPAQTGNTQGGKAGSDGGPARTTSKIDLTTVKIPVLAINGEFDKPNEKTTRMARELSNFKNVVLPGKTHMTVLLAGHASKQYIETLIEFINSNDPKGRR